MRGIDDDAEDTEGKSQGTRGQGRSGQGHERSNQTRAAPTHRVLKVVLKSRYALFSNMSRRMAEGGRRRRWSTWACKSRVSPLPLPRKPDQVGEKVQVCSVASKSMPASMYIPFNRTDNNRAGMHTVYFGLLKQNRYKPFAALRSCCLAGGRS